MRGSDQDYWIEIPNGTCAMPHPAPNKTGTANSGSQRIISLKQVICEHQRKRPRKTTRETRLKMSHLFSPAVDSSRAPESGIRQKSLISLIIYD
jgi:hypothetical protein